MKDTEKGFTFCFANEKLNIYSRKKGSCVMTFILTIHCEKQYKFPKNTLFQFELSFTL